MRLIGWILRGLLAVNFAVFFLTFVPAFSGIGPGPGVADRLWGDYRFGGWRADVVWMCKSTLFIFPTGLIWINENRSARLTLTAYCFWLACFVILLALRLSVGHGHLVDTPDRRWYMTVHSYENGYRALGRQLLLLPIEWTPDGRFRLPAGTDTAAPLPMPVPGTHQQPALDPSDDFTTPTLGLQWAFWHEFDPARFTTGNGALALQAKGDSLTNTSVLTTVVGAHSYTIEAAIEITPGCASGCASGLLLFYDSQHAAGILLRRRRHRRPPRQRLRPQPQEQGHHPRNPPRRQRPPGARLLLQASRPVLAKDRRVLRSLRHAAQRPRGLP